MAVVRHVTLPAGFVASGVKCGIKQSGREDLAVIACEKDAAAAAVTTRNQVIGAPVTWCRKILPKGFGRIRAFVINSGCSNVCTGKAGLRDAEEMAKRTAQRLGTKPRSVLVASTGIIGHLLPMDKIRKGIDAATASLGRDNDTAALHAIMTTDTRDKYAVVQTRLGGKKVTLSGIVKGSGMIAPSMATMIGVITTDAAIAPTALGKALREAVATTFNAITVDSDTSTSDTVAVLAGGAAGNAVIGLNSAEYKKFAAALRELCGALARAVVIDGEGATKLIEISVRGAKNVRDAEIAAKSVANSPLFKCAVHGGDPNWGRIAAALGKSSAVVVPEKLVIGIGGVTIFRGGLGAKFNLKKVEEHLKGREIRVECDLHVGKGEFTAWTCDLSREYITINADYHT
jgi:glutamate N-acetyltransferase/amino-acid N-acetyltransferase